LSIERIAVIGAGVMGKAVGQEFAEKRFNVVLVDTSDESLKRAKADITHGIRAYRLLNRRAASEPLDEIMRRIELTTSYDSIVEADFVIESVTEKWSIKKEVYTIIDKVAPQSCIFASNTSAIPITKIGGATGRPDRVLGIHFMNPVPLMDTVEMIRGFHTTDETIDAARGVMSRIGKETIVVNDSPGFVTNRVLMLTINEAIYLLHERVAVADQIDAIFKKCFGHKMGPLETADLIGLDTVLLSIEALYEDFNDSKYRPCPLLRRMVEAGLCGRKSMRGFYEY
jgi:3-hydroxybutyryl-CoA dehydrogenase